ncbi:NUDIX hydrolase [Clostridium fermenticellae]|uniref:NUDIX hydrolase n=1 Tax=Clostridium fermenticellae TaxID=2068654 RepID=A0A386H4H8_9CLOT|nr:NUDIX hydrolase [Clostridium fermenticellae]AYD40580.1 NUDIX hydrolase [Clostridium fermenticellae]
MEFFEKTIESKNIYSGKIINVNLHKVKLPNGREVKREIVNHPGGVAILAYKDSETILMVEQFRKPVEHMLLEIPAGKIEKGEKPEVCASRELEEETGYKAGKLKYLGKIVTSPGFCDECIYLYKAQELYKGSDGLQDEDEFINLRELNVKTVKNMIKDGMITDAKTVAIFMFE